MLNQIILMGRLTADPELRKTGSGLSVVSFTLAVERSRKNTDTGERETDFIRCTAWRGTAEFISKYFCKGKLCAVTGRLQINSYTDKDGIKRHSPQVHVEDVSFCGDSRNPSECNSTYGISNEAPAAPSGPADMAEVDIPDEEMPF